MTQYLRTTSVWAFAAGIMVGSLSIAAAATIGLSQAQEIPACDSLVVEYAAVTP